jgi:hypothetical protein
MLRDWINEKLKVEKEKKVKWKSLRRAGNSTEKL